MASDDILQDEIARRTAQGWEIVSRDPNEAQMRRPKRFSFGWALLWFLLFGVGLFVYLIWHWLKAEQLAYLRVIEGKLVVSERLGLLGWLLSPVRAYWRWAGSRQTTQAKALAYGGPIASVLVLIIIIAVATSGGGGGDEEGQPAAQAQPSPEAPAANGDETPAGEAPPEEQETPVEQETPEEPSIERIVAGVPGAVAEARGVRITLNDIVDPWVSPSEFAPDEPQSGNRFVVFDITMEYVKESGTHFACDINFRLTDTDAFAYDATLLFDLEPTLDCIGLGGGQKTRGWMGFELGEAAQLDLLKYDPDIFTTDDIEFQFQ